MRCYIMANVLLMILVNAFNDITKLNRYLYDVTIYIGLLLCKRMDNAIKTLSDAKNNLRILLKESPHEYKSSVYVSMCTHAYT